MSVLLKKVAMVSGLLLASFSASSSYAAVTGQAMPFNFEDSVSAQQPDFSNTIELLESIDQQIKQYRRVLQLTNEQGQQLIRAQEAVSEAMASCRTLVDKPILAVVKAAYKYLCIDKAREAEAILNQSSALLREMENTKPRVVKGLKELQWTQVQIQKAKKADEELEDLQNGGKVLKEGKAGFERQLNP